MLYQYSLHPSWVTREQIVLIYVKLRQAVLPRPQSRGHSQPDDGAGELGSADLCLSLPADRPYGGQRAIPRAQTEQKEKDWVGETQDTRETRLSHPGLSTSQASRGRSWANQGTSLPG